MKVSDNTLRELTGYRLQRATGIAMMRYKAVFAQFGLRRTTFSCLSLIVETPGLRQSQLGEKLSIERPNLVGIVEDLNRRGFIEKSVSSEDRRAYSLRPTAEGLQLFRDAFAAVQELDHQITEGMTKQDRTAFHSMLEKLESNAVHSD